MNLEDKEEMVLYRIRKSRETIHEIEVLVQNKYWSTAINRIYYACYYAVSALLLRNDLTPQSHAGTRQMFGLHFIKSGIISKDLGKFYSDIFDMRHSGDYDDFIDFAQEDVLDVWGPANELITVIEQIIFRSEEPFE